MFVSTIVHECVPIISRVAAEIPLALSATEQKGNPFLCPIFGLRMDECESARVEDFGSRPVSRMASPLASPSIKSAPNVRLELTPKRLEPAPKTAPDSPPKLEAGDRVLDADVRIGFVTVHLSRAIDDIDSQSVVEFGVRDVALGAVVRPYDSVVKFTIGSVFVLCHLPDTAAPVYLLHSAIIPDRRQVIDRTPSPRDTMFLAPPVVYDTSTLKRLMKDASTKFFTATLRVSSPRSPFFHDQFADTELDVNLVVSEITVAVVYERVAELARVLTRIILSLEEDSRVAFPPANPLVLLTEAHRRRQSQGQSPSQSGGQRPDESDSGIGGARARIPSLSSRMASALVAARSARASHTLDAIMVALRVHVGTVYVDVQAVEKALVSLRIADVKPALTVRRKGTDFSLRIGGLSLTDLTTRGRPFPDVVTVQGQQFLSMSLVSQDLLALRVSSAVATTHKLAPSLVLKAKVSAIRVIVLARWLKDLVQLAQIIAQAATDVTLEFRREGMRGSADRAPSVTTPTSYSPPPAIGVQRILPILRLDVSVLPPTIILPLSSTSNNGFVLDSGIIDIKSTSSGVDIVLSGVRAARVKLSDRGLRYDVAATILQAKPTSITVAIRNTDRTSLAPLFQLPVVCDACSSFAVRADVGKVGVKVRSSDIALLKQLLTENMTEASSVEMIMRLSGSSSTDDDVSLHRFSLSPTSTGATVLNQLSELPVPGIPVPASPLILSFAARAKKVTVDVIDDRVIIVPIPIARVRVAQVRAQGAMSAFQPEAVALVVKVKKLKVCISSEIPFRSVNPNLVHAHTHTHTHTSTPAYSIHCFLFVGIVAPEDHLHMLRADGRLQQLKSAHTYTIPFTQTRTHTHTHTHIYCNLPCSDSYLGTLRRSRTRGRWRILCTKMSSVQHPRKTRLS